MEYKKWGFYKNRGEKMPWDAGKRVLRKITLHSVSRQLEGYKAWKSIFKNLRQILKSSEYIEKKFRQLTEELR